MRATESRCLGVVVSLLGTACFIVALTGCGEKGGRALSPPPEALSVDGSRDTAAAGEMAKSAAPVAVNFGDYNRLPRVRITIPRKTTTPYLLSPPHPYVAWIGVDPDGDLEGMSYKYLAIPESGVAGGTWPPSPGTPHPWLPPLDHEAAGIGHASPPIGYWSEWIPPDSTYVSDLDLSAYVGKKVMVFVTAKDEAGGVLTEEMYFSYNADNNWVKLLISSLNIGLKTIVDAGMLGVRNSFNVSEYRTKIAGIFLGTRVGFKFWADEDRETGMLAHAYRYYYDDPEDPVNSTWNFWTHVAPLRHAGQMPEWWVGFPANGVPFAPSLGPHIFVEEVQDLNQVVSHCEFRIEVLPGPKGKDHLICLVDDERAKWMEVPYANYEAASDSLWLDILDGYNWESFDTGVNYENEVSIRRIGDATTVVWLADQDIEGSETQLLRVCWELGNYLNSYVKVGGNLIIIGMDPCYATMYWPDRQVYDPDRRAMQTSLDFSPRVGQVDGSEIHNFMWETFGITRMELASPSVAFTTLAPCEAGWDSITTGAIPDVPAWPGRMDNAFYITEVRDDIGVHRMYSMIPIDGQGQPIGSPECSGSGMRLVGVYVPGDGERGYAAYIGIPPWFFDHDQVETMIRQLLEAFGEGPGSR